MAMVWTTRLEGGPRRVNHAAARVGNSIYSFGGYCTGHDFRQLKPIDVHILCTSKDCTATKIIDFQLLLNKMHHMKII